MKYNYNQVQDGQKLWGVAYTLNTSKETKMFKCKPELGVVSDKGYYGTFTTLKKDGVTKSSKSVSLYARHYADTKEEAIELYNERICVAIDDLQNLIDEIRKDKI